MRHVLGRFSSRRWLVLAAVVFAGVAVVAVVVMTRGSGAGPAEVSDRFLRTTDCGRMRSLAAPELRAELADHDCETLRDVARGRRSYADPQLVRIRERTLHLGDPEVSGDRARVPVTASYAGDHPDDELVVELRRVDDEWRVVDWGLAEGCADWPECD